MWGLACAGFYKGRIAEAIVAALDEEKGVMTLDDLEQPRSTVTRPIHTTYRGHTIYEVPPPTQARPLYCLQCKPQKRASLISLHITMPKTLSHSGVHRFTMSIL